MKYIVLTGALSMLLLTASAQAQTQAPCTALTLFNNACKRDAVKPERAPAKPEQATASANVPQSGQQDPESAWGTLAALADTSWSLPNGSLVTFSWTAPKQQMLMSTLLPNKSVSVEVWKFNNASGLIEEYQKVGNTFQHFANLTAQADGTFARIPVNPKEKSSFFYSVDGDKWSSVWSKRRGKGWVRDASKPVASTWQKVSSKDAEIIRLAILEPTRLVDHWGIFAKLVGTQWMKSSFSSFDNTESIELLTYTWSKPGFELKVAHGSPKSVDEYLTGLIQVGKNVEFRMQGQLRGDIKYEMFEDELVGSQGNYRAITRIEGDRLIDLWQVKHEGKWATLAQDIWKRGTAYSVAAAREEYAERERRQEEANKRAEAAQNAKMWGAVLDGIARGTGATSADGVIDNPLDGNSATGRRLNEQLEDIIQGPRSRGPRAHWASDDPSSSSSDAANLPISSNSAGGALDSRNNAEAATSSGSASVRTAGSASASNAVTDAKNEDAPETNNGGASGQSADGSASIIVAPSNETERRAAAAAERERILAEAKRKTAAQEAELARRQEAEAAKTKAEQARRKAEFLKRCPSGRCQ